MDNILTTVTLESVNRRKDKSITLRFNTQLEQTSEQLMQMDRILNSSGSLYFKPEGVVTDLEQQEIDKVKTGVQGKSKSQQLRSVIYSIYQQKDCSNKEKSVYLSFEQFYSNMMELIINHYKNQIL